MRLGLKYPTVFSVVAATGGEWACTREYMPVCGSIQVECVTEPCDTVRTTFSNRCEAVAAGAFAIVDGAMNDLIRPALYGAWQEIIPVVKKIGSKKTYDVVGPVCESGDFLGKDRELLIEEGDLLAVRSAGAYGFSMSSNYNSRPRAAEVLVDGDKVHLARARETLDDLVRGEQLLPD